MKYSKLLLLSGSTVQCASALSPRVVGMDLQRRQVRDPAAHDRLRLRRRSGSVNAVLENEGALYTLNATVGTPAQTVTVMLDTGSSDLWFNAPSSALCSSRRSSCSAFGTFDANSSSTYEYVSSNFNITYADDSSAAGDYATDVFRVGETSVTGLQFGIGYDSNSGENVLGVGYDSVEAVAATAPGQTYKNFPARLAADGVIASNAYSLWLNGLEADTGSILFGGVDSAKYDGTLVTLPIQQVNGAYQGFLITLTGIEFGGSAIASGLAEAVLLDSGTSLTYLPDAVTKDIYDAVGAQYLASQGVAYVDCSLRNQATNLTFQFSDPSVITVPISEMVLTSSGSSLRFGGGAEACVFGIGPSGNSISILGDTFLRSAYVVYDLDNNEISLAQTNFNATTSNVVEIGSGTSAVPNATPASSAVAATGATTGTTASGSEKDTGNGAGLLRPGFGWALFAASASIAASLYLG